MSKTHRCIDCPIGAEHWVDEICTACGRCQLHCHEIVATFSQDAKQGERPHPDAGRTFRLGFIPPELEDPDRAQLPLLAGPDSESSGIQSRGVMAVQSGPVARGVREAALQGDDDRGAGDSVRGVGQRSAARPSARRRNSRGDTE